MRDVRIANVEVRPSELDVLIDGRHTGLSVREFGFIFKIRTKLAAVAPDHRFIHTHFGTGYRFAPEPEPSERRLRAN